MFCSAFSHAKPPRNIHAARDVTLSQFKKKLETNYLWNRVCIGDAFSVPFILSWQNWMQGYNPRHKSWNTCVIFPSPMSIWVCSHFSAPKYARLNIGEGERHIWVRTKVWSVNVRNLEKIQDKWLLFQWFVTSIVALRQRADLLWANIRLTKLAFLTARTIPRENIF